MRLGLALLLCAAALPLAADDVEPVLLSVQPSYIVCGFGGFETQLVVYNPSARTMRGACVDDMCGPIAPGGHLLSGPTLGGSFPTFLYLPKDEAEQLRMSLVTRSHMWGSDEVGLAELPIVRASEFRDKTIDIVGVRMEPGFRQALRLYALDGTQYSAVDVRVYDLTTNAQIYEEVHWLEPLTDQRTPDGRALAPAFNMECDLSKELPELLDGRNVRLEIEPLMEGMKVWAFMSITDNKTQHFSTIVPR